MTKSFYITNHAKGQMEERGIIPVNCPLYQAKEMIYNQIISTNNIYESLRSVIYIVNDIEYIFKKNTLITAIKH